MDATRGRLACAASAAALQVRPRSRSRGVSQPPSDGPACRNVRHFRGNSEEESPPTCLTDDPDNEDSPSDCNEEEGEEEKEAESAEEEETESAEEEEAECDLEVAVDFDGVASLQRVEFDNVRLATQAAEREERLHFNEVAQRRRSEFCALQQRFDDERSDWDRSRRVLDAVVVRACRDRALAALARTPLSAADRGRAAQAEQEAFRLEDALDAVRAGFRARADDISSETRQFMSLASARWPTRAVSELS